VWLRLLKRRGATIGSPRPQFGHGVLARVDAPDGVPAIVLGCYHPSRQNTNTGKLTPAMMESVFRKAKELLK
jgi:uracil-DNA glycosylase